MAIDWDLVEFKGKKRFLINIPFHSPSIYTLLTQYREREFKIGLKMAKTKVVIKNNIASIHIA